MRAAYAHLDKMTSETIREQRLRAQHSEARVRELEGTLATWRVTVEANEKDARARIEELEGVLYNLETAVRWALKT